MTQKIFCFAVPHFQIWPTFELCNSKSLCSDEGYGEPRPDSIKVHHEVNARTGSEEECKMSTEVTTENLKVMDDEGIEKNDIDTDHIVTGKAFNCQIGQRRRWGLYHGNKLNGDSILNKERKH